MHTTTTSPAPLASPIELIDRALFATGAVLDAVAADGWSAPSPCEGWDARSVANHLVNGLHHFAAELDDRMPPVPEGHDWLGDSPAAAYRIGAEIARDAWHLPAALETVVHLDLGAVPGSLAAVIHLTEIHVHGLDVAVAAGVEHRVDRELSEDLLALVRDLGVDAFRGPGIFGPEVPADDDAPAHRRLLAFLGRRL